MTKKTTASLPSDDAVRKSADKPAMDDTPPGETRASQVAIDGKATPAPKLPNERDESSDSQQDASASIQAIGKVAHHDAETSMDTDRGPVLDAVYNGPVTEGKRTNDDEDVHGRRDPAKSTSSHRP